MRILIIFASVIVYMGLFHSQKILAPDTNAPTSSDVNDNSFVLGGKIFMNYTDEENWKPIVGYAGRYEVSNHGRVRTYGKYKAKFDSNDDPSYIKPHDSGFGYLQIRLTRKGKTSSPKLHRLVAEYFLNKNDIFKTEVNHISGDKSDNHHSNLEWVTPSQNVHHAIKTGLATGRKLKREDAENIRKLRRDGLDYHKIANIYNCSAQYVYQIIINRKWKSQLNTQQ